VPPTTTSTERRTVPPNVESAHKIAMKAANDANGSIGSISASPCWYANTAAMDRPTALRAANETRPAAQPVCPAI